MKTNNNKPIIRFPDFDQDWKYINLNEVLTKQSIRNNTYNYKEVFSVSKDKGVINQLEHLGRSYASSDLHNYKVVFPNNLVYTKSPTAGFPFGIIKQNRLNRAGVVSVLYGVFKSNSKEMSNLLDIYFSSQLNTYNYLVPLVHKGAKNTMNICDETFLSGYKIGVPQDIEEQKKIVSFFEEIDKRIDQLLKKKALLSQYRKGIMQKLFNKQLTFKDQGNKSFPKWETYPINKILKRYSVPVLVEPNKLYTQIGIRSHGKGIFHKEPVIGKTLGKKRVFWVREDKLILNIVFAWERAISRTTIKENGKIASHRFPMYEPVNNLIDLDYIFYYFLTPKGKYYLQLASPGGAGRNKTLGQNEFEKLKITIPSLKEQVKISKFIKDLDKKISLIDSEISQTKMFKRGLLQKMFI